MIITPFYVDTEDSEDIDALIAFLEARGMSFYQGGCIYGRSLADLEAALEDK